MLVSSTSMNVASVTATAMIHGLTGDRHSAASFMVMAAAPILSQPLLRATGCELRANRKRLLKAGSSQPKLFNPHLRHDRHSRTQLVSLVLARLEHNLHRYALHNFDVVAGGVFRRQQAE